jgi:hypothetical protein
MADRDVDDVCIDDFRRWKVDPLKKFCRERGISVTKKRKEELVALAYALTIQKAPIVASKQQEKETVEKDYKALLTVKVGDEKVEIRDPKGIPESEWEGEAVATSKWPPCMYMNITDYLIAHDQRDLLTRLKNDYKEGQ